jgi:hypothetical protein
MSTDHVPAYVTALARHFADLRDDTHGNAHSRADKETLFATAVGLLDRYAREALAEVNTHLLLDTGTVTASGPRPACDGGTEAIWSLSWPGQHDTGVAPVTLHAFYGSGFRHPHLRGATVGDWPLNVFDETDAAQLPTLRSIAARSPAWTTCCGSVTPWTKR